MILNLFPIVQSSNQLGHSGTLSGGIVYDQTWKFKIIFILSYPWCPVPIFSFHISTHLEFRSSLSYICELFVRYKGQRGFERNREKEQDLAVDVLSFVCLACWQHLINGLFWRNPFTLHSATDPSLLRSNQTFSEGISIVRIAQTQRNMFKSLMSFDMHLCVYKYSLQDSICLAVCYIHQTFNVFSFLMFRLNSCNSLKICFLFCF